MKFKQTTCGRRGKSHVTQTMLIGKIFVVTGKSMLLVLSCLNNVLSSAGG